MNETEGAEPVEIPAEWSVVWIDARQALVARWREGGPAVERIRGYVPVHRRSTGHLRFDPLVRHGGGGGQEAGEPRRLEHLRRYLADVAAGLPGDNLEIVGPGTVREHLTSLLEAGDRRTGRSRLIVCRAAGRLTRRQLMARVRELMDLPVRRRTVGAYRWSLPQPHQPSGRLRPPRRVLEKPPDRGVGAEADPEESGGAGAAAGDVRRGAS